VHDLCWLWKAICITYSEYVLCVAFIIHHTKCMHSIILSYVACPSWFYFSTLSHEWYSVQKKVTERKIRVLILSTSFVWNISYPKKNWARCHKCVNVFMWSTRYSHQILVKLEFSQQIFKKFSKVKFNVNMSSGSRVVRYGWTDKEMDRRDKASSKFVRFCECVRKPTVVTNHSSNSQQNSSLCNSNCSKSNNDILGNM
jgi:hypothetical protein